MSRFLLALALFPTPVWAQDIVVTGQGLPPPPGSEAYGTRTIEAERLRQSLRLEDVLRDVAGFQQFRRTDSRAANPTSQGATLRALGGNAASRALVVLDGVPQEDPFAGFVPFAALRPERLARIRVTGGGGAGSFGAGALAGVIELDSASIGRPAARVEAGSRNGVSASAVLGTRLGNGSVTGDIGLERGDGFFLVRPAFRGPVDIRARYRQLSGALRAVVPAGDGELQASLRLFDDRRTRGLAEANLRTSGQDAALRFVSDGAVAGEALVYVQMRDFAARFASANSARTTVTTTLDQFATPATGLGAKLELRLLGQRLRVGADGRQTAGQTNEQFRFVAGSATALRRAGGVNTVVGAYAEGSQAIGALTLTGGIRVDHWVIANGRLTERALADGGLLRAEASPNRSGQVVTGRAGALWSLAPALSLRAAAYRGFRLPTLNELYRPFRVGLDAVAANPALRPERLNGVEAGLDYRRRPLSLSVTGFVNRLNDAIANVTVGSGPGVFPQVGFVAAGGAFRERRNLEAIVAKGIEADGRVAFGPASLALSYAYSDARVRGSLLTGRRPAQTARHQVSATAAYQAGGGQLSATLRYLSPQFEDDANTRALPAALTVDAFAEIPLSGALRLVARAENLFDRTIVAGVSATGLEDLAAPRTLWLGVRASL